MAQYVGIDVGYRDVGVVTVGPNGSATSRYVPPDGPPYEGLDERPGEECPPTFSEVLAVACSRTDGGTLAVHSETTPEDDYRRGVRRVASAADLDLDDVQLRLRIQNSVSVGNRELTPEEALAHVVAELLSSLGVSEDAYTVVAVPHGFDAARRTATAEAVESVGVSVVDVIDRAAAAALNCGADLGSYDRICVYDYGDTFRSTLLDAEGTSLRRVAGTESKRSTRAAFDDALADHLLTEYLDGDSDEADRARTAAAERVAHRVRSELRTNDVVEVEPDALPGRDESLAVDPDAVAAGTDDVVERTLAATDDLFDAPEVEVFPWQVDGLVLTGDVARVPSVADAVDDLFDSETVETDWTRLPTAGGAALGAVSNAPTDLVPRDVLEGGEGTSSRKPKGHEESDEGGRTLTDWTPWGDDSDSGSAESQRESASDAGGSTSRSASASDSETANRWWEYAVAALLAPVGLFVSYVVWFSVRSPPSDFATANYPVLMALFLVFVCSVLVCPFLFAVAASWDKRHLDRVTGRSRPRHPFAILLALVVTSGAYALFYVAWRRRKYGDGLLSGSHRNGRP